MTHLLRLPDRFVGLVTVLDDDVIAAKLAVGTKIGPFDRCSLEHQMTERYGIEKPQGLAKYRLAEFG